MQDAEQAGGLNSDQYLPLSPQEQMKGVLDLSLFRKLGKHASTSIVSTPSAITSAGQREPCERPNAPVCIQMGQLAIPPSNLGLKRTAPRSSNPISK